ncbi:MAG: TolC family outer membrane protein [Deltaproteobacteria bacterium]|nr:TolC family outer membrane protein [Deltaproteobacteria bacterium]
MKAYFKYLGILVVGVLVLGGSSAQGETLQDAINYLLQSNPEVKAISWNRMARDEEVRQAKSGYWPIIDIRSGIGVEEQYEPFRDTTHPNSTVASLRQNVYHFGTTMNEVQRQRARVRSAAYRLQGTSENVALVASRYYLNVLRRLELYDLAVENLTNHERIHDQVKLRSGSGVDSRADFDQVTGRLSLAQANVVVAKQNIIDAETDYQAVIGHLPEDLVKPAPVDSAIPASMEEAQQLALADQPILKSARADYEARESQHTVAKRAAYPSFDVAVDYRWENDVDIVGYQEELVATGIVSFNIFRGWWDDARIKETRHQICEAWEIMNNTRRQTVQSVRLSWESYRAAQDNIVHLEEYVASTGATAEAFDKQWSIGRRTMFDVLDIQAEYITAKEDLTNARYDEVYSQFRVLSGIGKLTHTLELEWPEESRIETN